MRLLMWFFWLSTLLPMAALLAWLFPAARVRWRESPAVSRLGLALVWLLGAAFLLSLPHEDGFTGLDNMAYRYLAQAFHAGRGFHEPDSILQAVPPEARENFLYHRGPVGRPTRDRIFQLREFQSVESRPFFMPTLPLAAAAQAPFLAPERFVPLVGAVWFLLLLTSAFCAGGGCGLTVALALTLGTAWPAWFLRGFYAEGVGAMFVSGVLAAAAIRPFRGRALPVVACLALGLAVTYHPTLILLAGPLAVGIALEQESPRRALGAGAGLLAGLLPFWAMTRWVCHPYGDWTRWDSLKRMVFAAAEHRTMALALVMLGILSVAGIVLRFQPRERTWCGERIRGASPLPWFLVACALPVGLVWQMPDSVQATLQTSARSVWSGIRWPFALLLLVAMACTLRRGRSLRERFAFTVLCWSGLAFLFIQGVETPVGLWSQRRFLPVVLAGIGLMAAPLSACLNEHKGTRQRLFLALLVLALGSVNLVRWPLAYVGVSEQGSAEFTRDISERIGNDRWVVFDYFPHSVPYVGSLEQKVLGLGESSRDRWQDMGSWLVETARSNEVWLATSWSPCTLEEGGRLEPVFAVEGRFPRVDAARYLPVKRGFRTVSSQFLRFVPLVPGESAEQVKILDGSPFGLRGPWGRLRNGETWSRQGSGIVGPMPAKGGVARFEAEFSDQPPDHSASRQSLLVTPPWGGEPLRIDVAPGRQTATGILQRPASDRDRPTTGTFVLHVEKPYDPSLHGLRGYSRDLGLLFRRVTIHSDAAPPDLD